MWIIVCSVLCALAGTGVIVFLIYRRTTTPPVEPLAEVVEIHKAAEAERVKIQREVPTLAQIKGMSDAELEKLVNDDTPVPGAK